jgi:large subunit ribosomal protein L40e
MAESSRLVFNRNIRNKCGAYTSNIPTNPKVLARILERLDILYKFILLDSRYLKFLPNIPDIQKELDFFEYKNKIEQLEKLIHAYTAAIINSVSHSDVQSDAHSKINDDTNPPSTDIVNLYKYYMLFSGLKIMNVSSLKKSDIYSFLKRFIPNPIIILVKTLTGKHIKVCINHYEQIEDLTLKIQEQEGVPVSQQRLVFAGKQLELTSSIMSYNIKSDDIVHLVLSLRGGMHHKTSTGIDRPSFFHIRCQDIHAYDNQTNDGSKKLTEFDPDLCLHSTDKTEVIFPPVIFPYFPFIITYNKKTIEICDITSYTQLHESIQIAFEYRIPRRYVIYCSIIDYGQDGSSKDMIKIFGTMVKQ